MAQTEKIEEDIEDLDEKIIEVRLSLGADLTDKIDSMRSKYMKKAGLIGSVIGLIGGAVAGFIYDANKNIPMEGEVLINGLMGLYFGSNLGERLGLFYSNYQSRKLIRDYPEYAEEIERYNKIYQSRLIAANNSQTLELSL